MAGAVRDSAVGGVRQARQNGRTGRCDVGVQEWLTGAGEISPAGGVELAEGNDGGRRVRRET